MSTATLPRHKHQLIEEAEAFAEKEIRPFAGEFEERKGIPQELIGMMAKKGYLAANLPESFGGLGLDPVEYGLLTEVIGKACPSTRSMLTVHSSLVGESLLRWGTEKQKNDWLPLLASGEKLAAFALSEPEIGSDARSVQTAYTKKAGHYILQGTKKWITMGQIADLFLVIAGAEGQITAFLVDRNTEGVSVRPIHDLMASKAAYLAEIHFDHVRVEEDAILGGEGNGFSYIVNTALDHGRYSVAWGGVGIAQAALEAMVSYARKRKQFGKGIYSFQSVQALIADTATGVASARALCLQAGQFRKEQHIDAIIHTTMAKYIASKAANQAAVDALQIHGANGFTSQYPVARLYREAKILEIIEGTTQVLQEVIADNALRQFYTSRR